MFEEIVEVVVGNEEVKFAIPTDLISNRSKFFKSACSERWNVDGKPIQLADEDPQTFGHYLKCVYENEVKVEDNKYIPLVSLYVLADKLGDFRSANIVIDHIMRRSDETNSVPSKSTITAVMERTVEKSPLRRLMIDFYVHEAAETFFQDGEEEDENDKFPNDFLLAVVRELAQLKNKKGLQSLSSERQKCYYHQHDESCPECEGGERGPNLTKVDS